MRKEVRLCRKSPATQYYSDQDVAETFEVYIKELEEALAALEAGKLNTRPKKWEDMTPDEQERLKVLFA